MSAAAHDDERLHGTLSLSRHADLKERHTGTILVLPEQAIRLQGSGAEILSLCDGTRDRDAILAALEARYPDTPELPGELDRFLAEMIEMGGIECRGTGAAP